MHFSRPAADELFQSVAEVYGPAAIGVLCTGTGFDGGASLEAIRDRGGATLVQDEATSRHFGMPGGAVRRGAASHVLPLSDISSKLVELARDMRETGRGNPPGASG